MTLSKQAIEALEQFPSASADALKNYFELGWEPGSFITALLMNDLKATCVCADSQNIRLIVEYVRWLYNYAPSVSWGSPEKVMYWIRQFKTEEQANV